MCLSIFLLLWLFSILLSSHSLPSPTEFPINCGASEEVTQGSLKFIPDEGYISVGNKSTIKTPGLLPILSTLRHFPDKSARKYCYELPVIKGGKYLLRTTYYYGGFDGGSEPPVFDQIVEGTKWSSVNTTEDYANGLSTYYEIIVLSMSKVLSVCLARNKQTTSDPFISALELEYLDDAMYNSTDFSKYALTTIARHTFGHQGGLIGFPDDQFSRFWQPFVDENPVVSSQSSVNSSEFWNFPPAKVFKTAMASSKGKQLKIEWPTFPVPNSKYYIALYLQDNRAPSPYSWRVLSISVNGKTFYAKLNVTTKGVTVYGREWPLAGKTQITLTAADNMPVGPLINAGEILQILPLGGRTLPKDVMAMQDLARSLDNPPADWRGDPCLPPKNSWTGVTCSSNILARVISLDLTNMNVSGSLPSSIDNLNSLNHLWLAHNNLSGSIPDMDALQSLQTLHLEDNQFQGSIPKSLGELMKLTEVFLQNNQLTGKIPPLLKMRHDINLKVSPGNNLSS